MVCMATNIVIIKNLGIHTKMIVSQQYFILILYLGINLKLSLNYSLVRYTNCLICTFMNIIILDNNGNERKLKT